MRWWWWVGGMLASWTAVYGGEPVVWLGQCPTCPPAPDQMRSPIRLFTQAQHPPQQVGTFARPAPSFHPVTQSPVQFASTPSAPGVRLASFCPPTVKLMPFVPLCVSTFHIHTPPPIWTEVPPRPGIQLVQVCESPGHHGPAFLRPNVTLLDQPLPQPPVHVHKCLPR